MTLWARWHTGSVGPTEAPPAPVGGIPDAEAEPSGGTGTGYGSWRGMGDGQGPVTATPSGTAPTVTGGPAVAVATSIARTSSTLLSTTKAVDPSGSKATA